MMERIEEFSRDGKNIVYIDFSGFSVINEFRQLIKQVEPIISKYPEKSVYTITNIENMRFDSSIRNTVVEYMQFNKPYVKCAAIVGIDGIKKIMAKTAIKLSNRTNFNFFFLKEEAIAWILQQE